MSRRRSNIVTEEVKRLKTKNDNVVFVLERLDDSYIVYLESYDERVDFIFASDDKEFMLKVLTFMVESYNEGFVDGKNSTIMFMNGM